MVRGVLMGCFSCSLEATTFSEIITINRISGVKTQQVDLLAP